MLTSDIAFVSVVLTVYLRSSMMNQVLLVAAQFGAARYDGGNFKQAAEMFAELATAPELADFLTLPAYDVIVQKDTVQAQSRM
jgi:malate synthase